MTLSSSSGRMRWTRGATGRDNSPNCITEHIRTKFALMTISQLPERAPQTSRSWRLIDVIDEEMDEKGKDSFTAVREKSITKRFQTWVRSARPSVRSNGKTKADSSRFTPSIAQPKNYTRNGTRCHSIASAPRSDEASGGCSYRLPNGARGDSVTSRIASEDSERPIMSEFPPITSRAASSRSRRSSKSSAASALPKGTMVAYEKPALLSVDGHPTEAEVGGATKRTFTSPASNTVSSGNSRRSHSGQSQGVASAGTGNNNSNGRTTVTHRLTTHSDKSTVYPRQRAQKPQSTGAYSAGVPVQQTSLKRAKSFGNFPRQLNVPSGSKARSAKLSAGNRQYTYTKQSATTTRRTEKPVQIAHSAENQNVVNPQTEVTSEQDVDIEKQDMILEWLNAVDGLAERPPSPEYIHHGSPEQSDTAIHVVYDGD